MRSDTESPDQRRARPVGFVRRRLGMAKAVTILGGLGLLLAACSSGSANAAGSNSTTTTSGAAGSASFAAYTNCLKTHGVNFTGGFFGGRGQGGPPSSGTTRPTISASERAALSKAESACSSLRPKGGFAGGNSTAFAAYRNCLKLHGVTLPSGPGAGGFPGSGTSTSTTSDPKEKAALAACAALRPKGGFGGGFPHSTTTTS